MLRPTEDKGGSWQWREHRCCARFFQGYMEGGASEGIRAATEILADLKRA